MTTAAPKPKSTKGEISFEYAFSLFWTEEEFHDATLEATDGLQVTANRFALAARNAYFRKLLLSQFKESKSPVVKIGFSGSVLKAVVQYIHTNKAELLLENTVDETNQAKKAKIGASEAICLTFQSILELCEASVYFDLPGLSNQTKECISSFLKAHPSLAFLILGNSAVPENIRELAFAKIQRDPDGCSKGAAAKLLSPDALQNLLKEDKEKLRMSHAHLFGFLELWSHGERVKSAKPGGVSATNFSVDRFALAKKLVVEHVDLSQISPTILSSSVASSGLVSSEDLAEAYKLQALKAEKEHGVKFEEVIPPVVWKASRSTEFINSPQDDGHVDAKKKWVNDILDCKPIMEGKHQWSVLIKKTKFDRALGVGVVTSNEWSENKLSAYSKKPHLGGSHGSWGYFGDGTAEASGSGFEDEEENQKFAKGSTVTLTLDLSPDSANNGSLSISVDGGPTITRFSNLCDYLRDGGFVPAASLGCPGDSVEIVDLQLL